MMKIDLHVHCLPASPCAAIQPEELPGLYQKAGLDGLVLTNHVTRHLNGYSTDYGEQAEMYIETYRRAKTAGEAVGFTVIFGAEVKLERYEHHPEFLLYGMTEELMRLSHPLFEKTQGELFNFCCEHDILMIQAHPLRVEQGYEPADLTLMHGLEGYNPNFPSQSRYREIVRLAKKAGLLLSAGSDCHRAGQEGSAWMVFQQNVADPQSLRRALLEEKPVIYGRNGRIELGNETDDAYQE